MRRLPSWLIVAALGVLVALAAADAIRPTGGRPRTSSSPSSLAQLRGVLLVAGPDCAAAALRLPGLVEERPPRPADCGGLVWSHDGTLAARCTGSNGTEILTARLEFTARTAGCSPAWRADGALGVIRGGDVVLWRRHGRPQPYLRRGELARELGTLVARPETYDFAEIAWLGRAALAAIVRGDRPWETAVAVFVREELQALTPQFGGHIDDLHVSPLGNVGVARNRPAREFVMISRAGEQIPLVRIANARAMAWSPDERWVAIATRTATFVGRVGTVELAARLPVGARSLAWLR